MDEGWGESNRAGEGGDKWLTVLIPPPCGEVDRREPVGWGDAFNAGILTPPAALFFWRYRALRYLSASERDSLPVNLPARSRSFASAKAGGRDGAVNCYSARRREGP
jgi:hypothetical protein